MLSDGFRRTGSLHVLALSGLQLVVIYGFISLVLRPLRSRVLRLALGTAVLLFYQFIAGPVPSLLRATLMLLAGSVALLLDRDPEPLNLLCLAGALLALAEPSQVLSLSFQLSFLALAGILLLGPLVSRPLEGRVPAVILEPLAASAGAQVATLPIVLASFGVYYPVGLIAGLVLVPLTTLLLWLGLAWLLLCPVFGDLLGSAVPRLFGVLYDLVSGSASFFSRAPGLAVGKDIMPWAAGIAAGAAVLLSFAAPRRLSVWNPRRRAVRAG
jgi:competence protein ComEC